MAKYRREQKPTGIDLIDNLTPAERKELRAKLLQHFDSLSAEEIAQYLQQQSILRRHAQFFPSCQIQDNQISCQRRLRQIPSLDTCQALTFFNKREIAGSSG